MAPTGSASTRLAIVRGNSGSGKSSVALAVRSHLGRSCAVAAQDVIRRTILKERDVPDGVNIGLLSTVARYALDAGRHVIVEGILHAERYGDMLADLVADHRGRTGVYYLDVSFDESLRRHATRPQAAEFGPEHMREWFCARDLLGLDGEQLIPPASSLQDTVGCILADVFDQQHKRGPAPADHAVLGSAVRE